MLTIARSTNPYIRGIKPRIFFEQRNLMMRKEIMLNDVSKDNLTANVQSKYSRESEYDSSEEIS